MGLFSYLYLVVDHIHYKLIKVMKLKAYSLLQKSEIPSLFHTDSLSTIDMITTSDSTTMIAGTGTTGDTTIIGGLTSEVGTTLIGTGILILGIIAHLLDRWLNRRQELELMDLEDQNQE